MLNKKDLVSTVQQAGEKIGGLATVALALSGVALLLSAAALFLVLRKK